MKHITKCSRLVLVAMSIGLTVSACGDQIGSVQTTPFKPVASLQELMQSVIDPSADALWEAVSTTVTANGEVQTRPETDEAWRTLRHQALQLAEAANLLLIEQRPVAHPGQDLEDAHVKAILKADEIQQLIAADRSAFAARAHALQNAALDTIKAIDEKNIDKFIEAGGRLDQACEGCHSQYWYPKEKRPTQ